MTRRFKIFKNNEQKGFSKSLQGAIESVISNCNTFGFDVKEYKITDFDDVSIVFWRGEVSDHIDYHDELFPK